MERGAWQATVHGVTRVGHDSVTKPPPPTTQSKPSSPSPLKLSQKPGVIIMIPPKTLPKFSISYPTNLTFQLYHVGQWTSGSPQQWDLTSLLSPIHLASSPLWPVRNPVTPPSTSLTWATLWRTTNSHSVCACLVAQSCLTLETPWGPPCSSVQGIFQARILEWVAIPFSTESSWPRDWTQVSWITGRSFTTEPPGKPQFSQMRVLT